jgi:cation diffusion facilitator CzcD-associated flavoprotein CzcO
VRSDCALKVLSKIIELQECKTARDLNRSWHLGDQSRMANNLSPTRPRVARELRILIIGGGISGIGMAVKLLRGGFENVTIFEKAASVGGTWRENTYPGIACDVPSHLYTFTFLANPNWSQMFAPGREIRAYLEKVAGKFQLHRRIKFNKEVVKSTYTDGQWHVETKDGEKITSDVLISAVGVLHVPKYPNIRGLDTFAGRAFHSSRWDHSVDLTGKRVGIIGNGSSSSQIVSQIVNQVHELYVFQRTAQWVLPIPNEQYSMWRRFLWKLRPSLTRELYQALLQGSYSGFGVAVVGDQVELKKLRAGCEAYLESIVDPDLRKKLTPTYEVACKRLVFSTKFYGAIQSQNCRLITASIEQVEPLGIRTSDGVLQECDVLILATGFQAHVFCRSIQLTGEGGLSLEQAWSRGAESFEAVGLAGFPNFFMVGGPFSTVGNLSFITCAELEADYIVKLLQKLVRENATAIVPTLAAQQRFMEDVRSSGKRTVWESGCDSWYLDEHGHVAIWTKTPEEFVAMIKSGPRAEDYRLVN